MFEAADVWMIWCQLIVSLPELDTVKGKLGGDGEEGVEVCFWLGMNMVVVHVGPLRSIVGSGVVIGFFLFFCFFVCCISPFSNFGVKGIF